MRVALVKKAAGGFGAANLTGKTAAMPRGGQNALQSDLRYRPRTGTVCFIPDFPSCRRGGQNREGVFAFRFREDGFEGY
jgi:hypothetical protein